MTLERIGDAPVYPACTHPEHDPPKHISLEPGTWKHTCPSCHSTQIFTIHGTRC